MKKYFLLLSVLCVNLHAIEVVNGTMAELIYGIVGQNVSISNYNYQFTQNSAGVYKNALVVGDNNTLNGVVLSSGNVFYLNSNYNSEKDKTLQLGLGPDSDLQSLLPLDPYVQTYDATFIEFDVVPAITGILKINYVFGSEEYFYEKDPLYERYTDVMGIFVNGINIAVLPETGYPVSVNTVNELHNSEYFYDNNYDNPKFATEMDGFIQELTAQILVVEGATYRFKFGVTDANDLWGDSFLLIGKNSLRVEPIEVEKKKCEKKKCGKKLLRKKQGGCK